MEAKKGSITINNLALKDAPDEYRKQFSFVPETPILSDELTLEEHLKLSAMAYGISESVYNKRITPLLKDFRLDKKMKWFRAHFSQEMKQKVMIMCAVLIETPLYNINVSVI